MKKCVVRIGTDNEWRNRYWISTSFWIKGLKIVVVNRKLISYKINTDTDIKVIYLPEGDILKYVLELPYVKELLPDNYSIELFNFYSPKDIEFCIGKENWIEVLNKDSIQQHRRISGSFNYNDIRIKIIDMVGIAAGGLNDMIKTYLPDSKFVETKGIAFDKKNMLKEFKNNPDKFIEYSAQDSECLIPLYKSFWKQMDIIRKEIGLSTINSFNRGYTTGSIVASMLKEYIMIQNDKINFCCVKLGVLNKDTTPKDRQIRNNQIQQALEGVIPVVNDKKYMVTGLSAGGVKWFASTSQTDSALYNAIVCGGRCNNERPDTYRYKRSADIDLTSCYGSALRNFKYPLGIPEVYRVTPNQDRITLGSFIKKHKHELVNDLFTIIVSGKLNFKQDLIYSTITNPNDLRKPNVDKKVKSGFALLRKEVVNGIITSDILNIINKVASSQEKVSLLNLEVVTAVWYSKQNELPIDNWCEQIIADKGEYIFEDKELKDSRSRKWCAIPLEGFTGKLVDMRNKVKKTNKPLSDSLKLIINSTYGDICSMYFPISNVVVANNITAKARCGVWLIAKSLGLRQTITDGGHYAVEEIPFFIGKKPSLQTYSNMKNWVTIHKSYVNRSYIKLCDWNDKPPVIKSGDSYSIPGLDILAKQHIDNFWKPYGIELPYDNVEHKNYVEECAYFNKSDYKFITPEGVVIKVRGTKKDNYHPRKQLIENILVEDDTIPVMDYVLPQIMTIPMRKTIQNSNSYEKLKKLLPGDNYNKKGCCKLNNIHIPIDDLKKWKQISGSSRVDKQNMLFEKFADIPTMHQKMLDNNLRTTYLS